MRKIKFDKIYFYDYINYGGKYYEIIKRFRNKKEG